MFWMLETKFNQQHIRNSALEMSTWWKLTMSSEDFVDETQFIQRTH